MIRKYRVLLLCLVFLTGVNHAIATDDYQVGEHLVPKISEAASDGTFPDISWDDLIPSDWLPEKYFDDLLSDDTEDIDLIEDSDPKAMALLERLREVWDAAPVVEALDGKNIRIPGFIVPLEGNDEEISEFLLVPYFGACIHVPPPPANQLIHVLPSQAVTAEWNMQPVWVSGQLSLIREKTDMGVVGYQMKAVDVDAYTEEER